LKSELAALDRKIQLELAPKQEETPSQGQEQSGGLAVPKAEKISQIDVSNYANIPFIRNNKVGKKIH